MSVVSTAELLLLISALAAIAVLQFFRGRKQNLIMLKIAAETLEKVFSPVDKIYRIVGIYVGFQAVYWLHRKNLDHAEATVLLLPRYSAFYFPVSKAVNRFDKIYLTFWFARKSVFNEIHVVREGAYRRSLRSVIRNFSRLAVSETVVKGVRFFIAKDGDSGLNKILRFLESLRDPSRVMHVALVPENNSLYIFARFDVDSLEELASESYKLAMSLA
ncbi:MAG: hypothetical protein GXO32_05770 [Crenarchaeota archaeon]|nr:hypothetical protein [Thermoproteota archaeon]